MRESTFTKLVKNFLESKGIYEAGTPVQEMKKKRQGWFCKVFCGAYQRPGIPDLMVCVRGNFLSVELKATKGRKRVFQELNIKRINQGGGVAIFLKPKQFDRFKEIVEYLLYMPRTRSTVDALAEEINAEFISK